MRRTLALIFCALALTLAACGSTAPRAWVSHPRAFTACGSPDCGPSAVTLNWGAIPLAGRTGYFVYLNGAQIADVNPSRYTFYGLDCGTTFTLGVRAHDGSGNLSTLITAAYTSPACTGILPPANTGLPVITGTPTQGQTLSTTNGTWTGSPSSFTYQWQRCTITCANIASATASTYLLALADIGDTIQVIVTASNVSGSTPATSARTAVVSGAGGGSCATTVSTAAAAASAVSSAADGAVICMAAGTSYGTLSLSRTGAHATNVVLEPVLGSDPNGAGKVSTTNITLSDGTNHLTVRDLYVTGGITAFGQLTSSTLDHNDISFPAGGKGINFFSAVADSLNDTISGNRIHDTGDINGVESDAIYTSWFDNLTVSGNDIYAIGMSSGFNHTDTFQGFTGFGTGTAVNGLTVTRNYIHDLNEVSEGFPFLKDGDYTNATISDNLDVRNTPNPGGGGSGIVDSEECGSTTITNNTSIPATNSNLRYDPVANAGDARCPPSGTLSHNILNQFNNCISAGSGCYNLTSDHNIFGASPFWWTPGATDTINAGLSGLTYKCGGTCGVGGGPTVPVGPNDDFELATNPNGIGIDWNPSATSFGPVNPAS